MSFRQPAINTPPAGSTALAKDGQEIWLDLIRLGAAAVVCGAAFAILTQHAIKWRQRRKHGGGIRLDDATYQTMGSSNRRTRRSQQAELVRRDVARHRLSEEVPVGMKRFRGHVGSCSTAHTPFADGSLKEDC